MNDADVSKHIEDLVAEEHRLYDAHSGGGGLGERERSRLQEIQVQLDRFYDLLRQRRAREEFGQDPSETKMRSGETVEHYLQ